MRNTLIATALAAAAAGVAAEPATFNIDPGHTIVTFEALHMNTSTQRGRIQAKEGSVVIDRAAKTGKADVTLDLTTLSAASSSLEGTLKGERLFNVAQGPTARFVADTFTFDGYIYVLTHTRLGAWYPAGCQVMAYSSAAIRAAASAIASARTDPAPRQASASPVHTRTQLLVSIGPPAIRSVGMERNVPCRISEHAGTGSRTPKWESAQPPSFLRRAGVEPPGRVRGPVIPGVGATVFFRAPALL